jgi:hypothetical protein
LLHLTRLTDRHSAPWLAKTLKKNRSLRKQTLLQALSNT